MQVKIVSEGGVPGQTKVVTDAGAEIGWITGITWRAAPGDICRAEIELAAVELNATAEARFLVCGKEVRRIEYADGSADEFPA